MSFIFRSYINKVIRDFFNKRVDMMFTTASKDVPNETSVVF